MKFEDALKKGYNIKPMNEEEWKAMIKRIRKAAEEFKIETS